jgi:acyl-CoA thioesterase I
MPLAFDARSRLLFVGDSITDAGRRDDPDGVGFGYVRLIRDYLRARDPTTAPHVLNAGISGDTVVDLGGRWSQDVLAHRPDIISIMIGVNDVWHRLENAGNGGVPIGLYKQIYAHLLQVTADLLPTCKIVLCEPTIISPPAHPKGNEELSQYVEAVHRLAREARAETVVPLHGAFLAAQKFRPDIDWTTDGVHPTSTGHMLIARTWLQSTGSL